MPDSSPQSHTHSGNFCAVSIWFSLPFNLPMSDLEKVGQEMGEDVAKAMDETELESGCRVRVEVREQQRARAAS